MCPFASLGVDLHKDAGIYIPLVAMRIQLRIHSLHVVLPQLHADSEDFIIVRPIVLPSCFSYNALINLNSCTSPGS